jgi:uncharacterized protein
MRSARVTAVVILSLIFPPLLFASGASEIAKERIVFEPSRVSVLAERADSPEKRSRGLMDRASLGEKEAMIFYFDESAYHTFWMYNTRIPLTIVFLNDRFTIVDIKDMVPCPEKNADLCPIYTPQGLARYAIELNRGFAERYGIKVGDRITIKRTYRH